MVLVCFGESTVTEVTVSISGSNRLGVDADWSDGKTLYIKAELDSDWKMYVSKVQVQIELEQNLDIL